MRFFSFVKHISSAMRLIPASLALLLAATCWAASIPTSGTKQNENSTEPTPPLSQGALPPVQPAMAHPMAAYLTLRPMLPLHPMFFPPIVDANAFVDQKAALLGNLFGAPIPTPASAGAAPVPGPVPGPATSFAAPGFFATKKFNFLNALLASQKATNAGPQQAMNAAPEQVQEQPQARRALPGMFPMVGPIVGLAVGPEYFAGKKVAFLHKLWETLNATAVPPSTPAPAPSWLDLLGENSEVTTASEDEKTAEVPTPLPRVPLALTAANDDKVQLLSALYDSLGLPQPTPKPTIVPPNFWSPFFAPPPAAVDSFAKPTIVPADFWVPPGKPMPSLFKAKAASFLSKLFQTLNATATPPSGVARRDVQVAEEAIKKPQEETEVSRRGLAGPFAGPFGGAAFGGPFGGSFAGPFGASKFGGPMGFGKPFGAVVDPKFFMDKKTTFMNQLFASKAAAAPAEGTAPGSSVPSSFGPFAPTPTPTIVPPDFWNPFPSAAAPTSAPRPTIVPPNFWTPFGAQSPAPGSPGSLPAALYADKKGKSLSTHFAGLQATPVPITQKLQDDPSVNEEADFNSFLQEMVEALTSFDQTAAAAAKARRDLTASGFGTVSPDAARQKMIDSAVAQMAVLKNDMVSTVDEILKQKAQPPPPAFPFPKSPYATMYGGMKKGGPATGKGGAFGSWGGGAAPTADPTAALQQRLQVLSQTFDSLAALEKDASAALQTAGAPAPAPATVADPAALLQLLLESDAGGAKAKKAASRKAKGAMAAPRSVQFAVRQGQLSLPPGAEELLTAGGGASPDQQEGGGLRLQAWQPEADYPAYDEEERPRNRHHSHHNHQ